MESLIKQLQNFTVLCVEDESGIRKRLVNTLKYYFKEVYESSSAEDGYDLYKEYKPDLIISDIQMPNRNGISMIQKIREEDLDVVIMMLTAYSSEEYLLELINLNINQFTKKPVNSDSLLDGVVKSLKHLLIQKLEFSEELYFDMERTELFYQDEIIPLRKRDKEFIILLHKNKNTVITYSLIEENLWRDRMMSVSALKTFIKEFRQRIPFDLIINVPQVGYKLITK